MAAQKIQHLGGNVLPVKHLVLQKHLEKFRKGQLFSGKGIHHGMPEGIVHDGIQLCAIQKSLRFMHDLPNEHRIFLLLFHGLPKIFQKIMGQFITDIQAIAVNAHLPDPVLGNLKEILPDALVFEIHFRHIGHTVCKGVIIGFGQRHRIRINMKPVCIL